MNRLQMVSAVILTTLCGACGIIGLMGRKSYHEQKIPAELQLKNYARGGVLVFVEQARAAGAGHDLPAKLSDVINAFLVRKARIKSESFVPRDRIMHLRSVRDDFARLTPVEVGAAVGAAVVLYTLIEDYELYEIPQRGYHSGFLVTRSIMFDVDSGRVLWPVPGDGRVVTAKVELETAGRDTALNRLINTTAHCITRSLYDCPKVKFRTADEGANYNTEKW